jgi:hypothetical protein
MTYDPSLYNRKYVTSGSDTTLTNERPVIAGGGIQVTDTGSQLIIGNTASSGGSGTVFQSSDSTITSAGTLTFDHGLTSPSKVWLALVNQTGENGYSAGDVLYTMWHTTAAGRGVSSTLTSTQLIVRFGDLSTVFQAHNKSTGATVDLTNANWKVRFFVQ